MALGKNQIMAMDAMQRFGGQWSGWVIDNNSTTRRILDSLMKHGLVTAREMPNLRTGDTWTKYELTAEGWAWKP